MTVRLQGSTSGYVELDSPAVGGNNTLVLPSGNGAAGQVLQTNGSGALSWAHGAASGPVFKAYSTTAQSISANTPTKIQFNAETFDTNNCFDSTTNYRFTPTVAGYYQINALVYFGGSNGAFTVIQPFRNGGSYASVNSQRSNGNFNAVLWNDIVYFNGSSDYFEIYAYDNATCSTVAGVGASLFSGALVRPA